MDNPPTSHPDESGWYEIRLHGLLAARWAGRFEPLALTTADGCTLLAGPVVDQAALHGLLQQLRDLGLPLASVLRLEGEPAAPSSHDTPPTGA